MCFKIESVSLCRLLCVSAVDVSTVVVAARCCAWWLLMIGLPIVELPIPGLSWQARCADSEWRVYKGDLESGPWRQSPNKFLRPEPVAIGPREVPT